MGCTLAKKIQIFKKFVKKKKNADKLVKESFLPDLCQIDKILYEIQSVKSTKHCWVYTLNRAEA